MGISEDARKRGLKNFTTNYTNWHELSNLCRWSDFISPICTNFRNAGVDGALALMRVSVAKGI